MRECRYREAQQADHRQRTPKTVTHPAPPENALEIPIDPIMTPIHCQGSGLKRRRPSNFTVAAPQATEPLPTERSPATA
jgi:hypothetical protein